MRPETGDMNQMPDFRPDLQAAHQWMTELLSGVTDDQLSSPTPCTEYDVRDLVSHLWAVPDRLRAIAAGRDPNELPTQLPLDDDLAAGYRQRATAAEAAWADDALLGRTVIAPWGEAPGAATVGGFVMETVTHGWDLAVATGQPAEFDPAVVAKARAVGEQALTGAFRGPGAPFGPEVEPRPAAGPTEQLAAFLGRSWPDAPVTG